MKLYAAYVIFSMAQCHNLAFTAAGYHLQLRGQALSIHHPRVVTPHLYLVGQACKEIGVCTP